MQGDFQPATAALLDQPLQPSELSRQSLYVKFDPLVGGPAPPPHRQYLTGTSLENRDKLLDFATPEPRRGSGTTAGGAGAGATGGKSVDLISTLTTGAAAGAGKTSDGIFYTESELQQRISEALARAHREAAIVQAETEDLHKRLKAEVENNRKMANVVEEYSKAMGDMLEAQTKAGGHDDRMAQLAAAKTQLEADLRSTETAFSDLHAKYHKAKDLIETYKQNEVKLKDAVATAQDAVAAEAKRYDVLKAHAEAKIAEANVEIAGVREHYKSQIQLLTVKAKKAEAEVESLRRQLEIKEADNKELTSICDDLVKQLDGRPA